MRFPRLLIAALALTTALTACSGDDSEPEGDESPGESSGASPGATPRTTDEPKSAGEERGCRATVKVTGTVEASWKGKATVRSEEAGPGAVYLTAKRKKTVTAYAKGEDFPASVNFYDGKQVFATQPGSGTGLDIRPNGKLAEVDAEAYNVEGDTVQVVVTFDCRRKSAKG